MKVKTKPEYGIRLTADGPEFYSYNKAISNEEALEIFNRNENFRKLMKGFELE